MKKVIANSEGLDYIDICKKLEDKIKLINAKHNALTFDKFCENEKLNSAKFQSNELKVNLQSAEQENLQIKNFSTQIDNQRRKAYANFTKTKSNVN